MVNLGGDNYHRGYRENYSRHFLHGPQRKCSLWPKKSGGQTMRFCCGASVCHQGACLGSGNSRPRNSCDGKITEPAGKSGGKEPSTVI